MKAVQLLLKKKSSDVNASTEYGWTALHWAANGRKDKDGGFNSLRDILQLLLRKVHEVCDSR